MIGNFLIYGANGYTGRLTTRLAVERGMRPVLGGRSADGVRALAHELGLEGRVFSLDDPVALRANLDEVDLVLHTAGPFSATSRPMVEACLASGVHYLDVTGEIAVFEAIFARDAEARAAGVTLIPGVGFDVVPTDCLAAMLARRLPTARHLELAFYGLGKSSRGTMKTTVESLGHGGRARVDGEIVRVPTVWKSREVPFPSGPRTCVSIPWGDVSTAFHSTGIPNVCVYMALPKKARRMLRLVDPMGFLLRRRFVQRSLKRWVDRRVTGPSEDKRRGASSDIWGEARAPDGTTVTATLTTPDGYTLTADAALRAVERVLAGGVPAGCLTPSKAFGPDFVASLDGVKVYA